MLRFVFSLFATIFWGIAFAAPTSAAPCGTPGGRSVRVSDIDERLEIVLEDGRRLQLVGIESPRATSADPQRLDRTRAALRDWLTSPGQDLDLELLAGSADRWNRYPARIFARTDSTNPISVAEALVDAGLVRVHIDPLARPCLRDLLALEDAARRARTGIWNDPAFAVVPAHERAAFASRSGETILVEGHVIDTGRTATRVYLNFGPIRTVDFAASVARQNWATFEAAGMNLEALRGKRVRLRGMVELQSGPQIEIADPEAIEIVETQALRPPYSRPKARQ